MSDASRKPPRRKVPRWLAWTGWTLLSLILLVGIGAFITRQFGGVYGVELNPHTFARRSYSFYEIPLLGWQVVAIRRDDIENDAVTFLIDNKYITDPKKAPDEWHLVQGIRGVSPAVIGDAKILAEYLEIVDANSNYPWVDWSTKHPQLAKVLWPAVSRLARDEQYLYVDELFDLAQQASDPVAFQTAVNAHVASRLFALGSELQSRNLHGAAKKYLSEAAQLDPLDPSIKTALAKSVALSKDESAPAATKQKATSEKSSSP
jgi:hypothetical protein